MRSIREKCEKSSDNSLYILISKLAFKVIVKLRLNSSVLEVYSLY